MRTDSRVVANLLRSIADTVEQLDESRLRSLLSGKCRVTLTSEQARGQCVPEHTQETAVDQSDVKELVMLLQQVEDRDSGLSLLEERCKTKACLYRVTQHLDLPNQRRDTSKKMKEDIIEATIGFRLRSRAIQESETR